MNILDILIGIPLLWVLYKGFSNGLIIEVTKLSALILGIFGAVNFSDYTAEFLLMKFELNSNYTGIIAFAITFIGIIILIHFTGKALDSVIKAIALGTLNRLLGMLFGLLKGVILVSIIIYFTNSINSKFNIISSKTTTESHMYIPMLEVSRKIFNFFNSENLPYSFSEIKNRAYDL